MHAAIYTDQENVPENSRHSFQLPGPPKLPLENHQQGSLVSSFKEMKEATVVGEVRDQYTNLNHRRE